MGVTMTRALEASFGATVVRSEVESTICIHGCNCTSWPGTPLLRYAARWRRWRPFAAPPSSRCARGRDTGMSPHRSATRVAVGRSRRPQSSPLLSGFAQPRRSPTVLRSSPRLASGLARLSHHRGIYFGISTCADVFLSHARRGPPSRVPPRRGCVPTAPPVVGVAHGGAFRGPAQPAVAASRASNRRGRTRTLPRVGRAVGLPSAP